MEVRMGMLDMGEARWLENVHMCVVPRRAGPAMHPHSRSICARVATEHASTHHPPFDTITCYILLALLDTNITFIGGTGASVGAARPPKTTLRVREIKRVNHIAAISDTTLWRECECTLSPAGLTVAQVRSGYDEAGAMYWEGGFGARDWGVSMLAPRLM